MSNQEFDADYTARLRNERDRPRTEEEIAEREAVKAAQQPVNAPPSVEPEVEAKAPAEEPEEEKESANTPRRIGQGSTEERNRARTEARADKK